MLGSAFAEEMFVCTVLIMHLDVYMPCSISVNICWWWQNL